ncbi:MAG TPA: cupin domain-containing protein [Candidatus Dormibacteraeota bacterium]|nr:cupin domain-containing protein [Candidatus Dormibacteraeota bacterium]
MDVIRHRPESRPGPAENFTGTVWIDTIVVTSPGSRLRANSVHFSPGARTAWHAHRNGQVLHVTEGTGRAQERGGPLHEIRAGDTVVSTAGEWHWHGAAPHHFMTHIGMSDAGDGIDDTTWGAHLTDVEYAAEVTAGAPA